ncbi:hypothetical protein DFH06DRAFT_1334624 [Mycena polygramma]|nr:hypothetical protein DFH06DRAFT_1334624 [Mycena polygramma]
MPRILRGKHPLSSPSIFLIFPSPPLLLLFTLSSTQNSEDLRKLVAPSKRRRWQMISVESGYSMDQPKLISSAHFALARRKAEA